MAETIRGISVVIGAETTALTAALSDVTKKSRDIQSELNQVQRLLRMDPGNTTLLAQQQQLLTQAVETSREKLDALRAAQQQVSAQFARGEISEGQYRAFQREVAAAEQQLSRFENRLRESQQAANNLSENLQKTGEKMKGVGEKMSLGITAPIVAAGAVIAKGALDAQNATGDLQAQLGLTADEAADLGAVAQSVWKSGFGDGIADATEAVKQVRQNMGILAEDELDQVAQGALVVSQVFDADVKESTAAAGVVMKSFGIDGQTAMDLITVGFQKGGDFSGELLDTLREYSPQFATMGMSADQMLGILISGAQAGAFNLDKVGDAVKEFNIRAQDGSTTTAQGFAAIGLNAQEMGAAIAAGGEKGQAAFTATIAALAAMEDPMARDQAGVALFGTQWEDLRGKVVLAMADSTNKLGDFNGATAAAADAVRANNPGIALAAAFREVQTAVGPIITSLADIIQNSIVPAVQGLAQWFATLSPEARNVAVAVAGIAAAIGPVLVIIGSLAGAIPSITAGLGALGVGVGAAGLELTGFAAVLTGPVGLAIAGTVLAVGGLYLAWKDNVGGIHDVADELGRSFREISDHTQVSTNGAIQSVVNMATESERILRDLAAQSATITGEQANAVINNANAARDQAVQAITARHDEELAKLRDLKEQGGIISDEMYNDLVVKANERRDKEIAAQDEIKNQVTAKINELKNSGITVTKEMVDGIIADIHRQRDEVIPSVASTAEQSEAALQKLHDNAGQITAEMVAEVVRNANTQRDQTVTAANEQYEQTIAKITALRDESKSITAEQADALIAKAQEQRDVTISKAREMRDGIIEQAKAQAGEHIDEVNYETGQVKSEYEKFADDVKRDLEEAWLEVFGGDGRQGSLEKSFVNFGNSVENGVNDVVRRFNEMGDRITDEANALARDALNWGRDVVQGMANGIRNWVGNAVSAAKGLAQDVKNAVTDYFIIRSPSKVMAEIGENIGQGLANGIQTATPAVIQVAKDMSTSVEGILNTLHGNVLNSVAAIKQAMSSVNQGSGTWMSDGTFVPAPTENQTPTESGNSGSNSLNNTPVTTPVDSATQSAITAGHSIDEIRKNLESNGLMTQYLVSEGKVIVYDKQKYQEWYNQQPANKKSWGSNEQIAYATVWSGNVNKFISKYGNGLAEGGGVLPGAGPILTWFNELNQGEVAIPFPKLLPLMTNALMGAIGRISGSSNALSPNISVLVTGNNIQSPADEDRLADKVSQRIARKFGLSTGGAW